MVDATLGRRAGARRWLRCTPTVRLGVAATVMLATVAALGAPANAADCPRCSYRFAGTPGQLDPTFGDGGAARDAKLNNLNDVTTATDGAVWIAQAGTTVIRRVTTDGKIHTGATLPSSEATALAPGANGHVWVGTDAGLHIYDAAPNGTLTAVTGTQNTGHVNNMAADGSGNLFVATAQATIYRLQTSDGHIDRYAGGGGGNDNDQSDSLNAAVTNTRDLVVHGDGSIDFTEANAGKVRRVAGGAAPHALSTVASGLDQPDGLEQMPDRRLVVQELNGHISELAGSAPTLLIGGAPASPAADGQPALGASFGPVTGISIDSNGRILLAVPGAVWRVTPPHAPYSSPNAAVKGLYVRFVLRQPTASELSTEAAKLTETGSEGTLANKLRQTSVWDGKLGPVIRLYQAYFLRPPDAGGLDHWVGVLRAGTGTLNTVSQSFVKSNEFKNRYGNRTNAQFVDLVYQNVLGRGPDAGGRTFWIAKLNGGYPRGSMMTSFSESSEHKTKRATLVAIVELYRGLLGRVPTTGETTAITSYLTSHTLAQVAEGILGLTEYMP